MLSASEIFPLLQVRCNFHLYYIGSFACIYSPLALTKPKAVCFRPLHNAYFVTKNVQSTAVSILHVHGYCAMHYNYRFSASAITVWLEYKHSCDQRENNNVAMSNSTTSTVHGLPIYYLQCYTFIVYCRDRNYPLINSCSTQSVIIHMT